MANAPTSVWDWTEDTITLATIAATEGNARRRANRWVKVNVSKSIEPISVEETDIDFGMPVPSVLNRYLVTYENYDMEY